MSNKAPKKISKAGDGCIVTDDHCLADLRVTDPRDDKVRIEQTKGGLLRDSYRWILDNPSFRQWRDDPKSRLLCIKGDPGKGKTMLLCGVVDELNKSTEQPCLPSFFFCQATDTRLNNATAVLRGLIYLLINQQPSLISHVRKKYNLRCETMWEDQRGRTLFEDANALAALFGIFTDIMQDPTMGNACFVIDALDECMVDLPQLVDFIIRQSSVSSRVKWIVSSRNCPEIESLFETAGQQERLCLDLNAESIAAAVVTYIQHKVLQLTQLKKYDSHTESMVRDCLLSNANDNFLWVALVCQDLYEVPRWNTVAELSTFQPGLDSLYGRILDQIYNSDKVDLCQQILATVTAVRRPITIQELTALVETLEDISNDIKSLSETIGLCGSFLILRERTVYFVHQSAKDFLLTTAFDKIFPSRMEETNHTIFSRSLKVMSRTLHRDMYGLRAPGFLISNVKQPDPDPLAAVRYSCVYWVSHLCDSGRPLRRVDNLQDIHAIDKFLSDKYIYWLEALSLFRSIPEAVLAVEKLENLILECIIEQDLIDLIHDARRFILSHQWIIEDTPLQVYASALIFSPTNSLVRRLFSSEEPKWIEKKPVMEAEWNTCLKTFEGHNDGVISLAFSPGNKYLASGSRDKTVKIWDVATSKYLQTLDSDLVFSITFSADGKHLATGGETVKIWNTATGKCLQTFEGHSGLVCSVAFSADGQHLASGGQTVKIWETETGKCLQTFEACHDPVFSVAFSAGGKHFASCPRGDAIKVWDVATSKCLQTFEGHNNRIHSLAISADGKHIALGSLSTTVKICDVATGECLRTFEESANSVSSVAFSADGKHIASSISGMAGNKTIVLRDVTTGKWFRMFEAHRRPAYSLVFSGDGRYLASGSEDNTVKIWDAASGKRLQMYEGHGSTVSSVAFSTDGKYLASGSHDHDVKIWDVATGKCLQTLEGHWLAVYSLAFSANSKHLASGSGDKSVKIWDVATGKCLRTLDHYHYWVVSLAFSADGVDIASGLRGHWDDNNTVVIRNATTGKWLQKFEGHSSNITSVAFSADGKQLASSSLDKTVKIWDAATGKCLQTIDVGTWLTHLSFGPTGSYLLTKVGRIKVEPLCDFQASFPEVRHVNAAGSDAIVGDPVFQQQDPKSYGYDLSPDRCWITYNDQNVLRLPLRYRGRRAAVLGRTICVGGSCPSGQLLILSFSPDV